VDRAYCLPTDRTRSPDNHEGLPMCTGMCTTGCGGLRRYGHVNTYRTRSWDRKAAATDRSSPFLNRVSEVRVLPGALSSSARDDNCLPHNVSNWPQRCWTRQLPFGSYARRVPFRPNAPPPPASLAASVGGLRAAAPIQNRKFHASSICCVGHEASRCMVEGCGLPAPRFAPLLRATVLAQR
jgi:hypothetical protein